jgi:ABC-type sugar transport system permease subunit
MEKKKGLTGYGFLTPWLFGLIMFVLIPVGLLTYNSFHLVKQDGQSYNRTFVGFENYQRILRVDIDFMVEVQDFVVRVLLFTPVIIALAVIVAMLLNQSIKGKAIFRLIFFLPVIILNGQLLSTMRDNGGMDIHLSRFVLDVITTIVPVFALDLFIELFSIIIEILWYTGVPILIFLAMLQKIDRSLYEAASIDGANAWSIFWKITLPIIRPAISVSVIFIVVFLANFDGNPINALIVSSNGNPSRYQGYAAAMAIIYSIIQVFVIGILLLITTPRNKGGRR